MASSLGPRGGPGDVSIWPPAGAGAGNSAHAAEGCVAGIRPRVPCRTEKRRALLTHMEVGVAPTWF